MNISQITDYGIFMQYGIAGVVLAWFMFRVERRMDDHTNAVNDLARSILLDLLARETLPETVRNEAKALMERVSSRSRPKN